MTEEHTDLVRQPNPLSSSLALSSGQEWNGVIRRWAQLMATGAVPAHIKSPEQCIAITRFGDAYGWNETRSLQSIYIVNGNPCLKTEAMGALVMEKIPTAQIEVMEASDTACRVRARRSDAHPWNTSEFTLNDARRAGLLNKGTWKQYPADMLYWRAHSRLYRRHFADATNGAYTLEDPPDAEWSVSQGVPTSNTLPASMLPPVEAEDVTAELVAPCDLCGGVGEHDVDCPHWVDDSPPVITPGGGSDGGARPPSGDGGAT